MNAWTPTPAEPADAPSRHERQLALLDRLADIGMEVAEAIGRQAANPDSETPNIFQGDLALAYSRAARAVRMTIALSARLVAEAARPTPLAPAERRERKERIGRIVTRLIGEAYENDDEGETAEHLTGVISERLDDGDIYGDVMRRPVSEIIAEICADLDIAPSWADFALEGWAREEMQDGPVGAPLLPHQPSPPCLSRGPITVVESELAPLHPPPEPHSEPFAHRGPRNGCEGDGEVCSPTSPPTPPTHPPPPAAPTGRSPSRAALNRAASRVLRG